MLGKQSVSMTIPERRFLSLKNSFENVIKRLKNLGLTLVKHPPYLDIFYKDLDIYNSSVKYYFF